MKFIDKLIDRLAVRIAEETVARQGKPTVINVTNHRDDRACAANMGVARLDTRVDEILKAEFGDDANA